MKTVHPTHHSRITTGLTLLVAWQLACVFAVAGPFDLMPLKLAERLRGRSATR
jgi:hypothetical protein